mgnify:CR=1 FL=1
MPSRRRAASAPSTLARRSGVTGLQGFRQPRFVELWQQREVALRAFYEGVTCGGVPEVAELAEGFRREAWVTTPVESRLV